MALLVTSNGSMGASNQVGFMQSVGGAAGVIGGLAQMGKNKNKNKENDAMAKARKNVGGEEVTSKLPKYKGMKDEFGEVVEKKPSSRRKKAEDSAREFEELKKGANSALGQALATLLQGMSGDLGNLGTYKDLLDGTKDMNDIKNSKELGKLGGRILKKGTKEALENLKKPPVLYSGESSSNEATRGNAYNYDEKKKKQRTKEDEL